MPVKLTDGEIAQIQERYSYLTSYDADDPECPIDPLTYADSNGDQLLHIAAQRGDLSTLQLLIRVGVDVNLLGDMGCTALHYARMNGHHDVAALLLDCGASEALLNQFGKPP